MRYGPRLALLGLLLLAVVAPVGVVGQTAAEPAIRQETPLRPEETTLTIQLQPDGDAAWTVSTAFILGDRNDTRAFERLAADFESGNAEVAYDAGAFEAAATAASEATGREMSIENVRYEATVNRRDEVQVGRLRMRFRWTNFAEESGDRIHLGDAFNTTDGTWLPGLTSRQTLVIRPPERYSVETAPVPVRGGVLRWEGPRSFEPGYLGQIVYTGSTPTPTSPTSPTPDGESLGTLELVGGGLLLFAALALGGYAVARRDGGPFGDGDAAPRDGGDGAGAAGGGTADGGAVAAGAADASSEGGESDGADDEPDWELLSDEERVEYLLEENGGRMKQASIVSETGWSNAKVSQLLSAMDDADQIDKLRIGRENLISLPDEGVGEFDSGEK